MSDRSHRLIFLFVDYPESEAASYTFFVVKRIITLSVVVSASVVYALNFDSQSVFFKGLEVNGHGLEFLFDRFSVLGSDILSSVFSSSLLSIIPPIIIVVSLTFNTFITKVM